MGFTEIDLGSWTQDHPQWQENTSTEMFPLTTDESLMKKKSAAEQQIFLELIFSEQRTKPVEEEGDADSEEEEDGGDKRNAKLSPEAIQAANEAKKKEEEEKRALMKKMEEMEVVDGDYSLTVHIIEVRDLAPKAKFANADPVVEVHAFDQKATTVMKKDTLNAVFDETFQFNLKDVTRDDLEAGLIQLSVYDIDLIGRDLIGSFATDFHFHALVVDKRWDLRSPEYLGTQNVVYCWGEERRFDIFFPVDFLLFLHDSIILVHLKGQ